MLEQFAPDRWWDGPASISGRHHNGQTNRGHAAGTVRVARLMWRRVPWDDVRVNPGARHAFMLAAALHDIGKTLDRKQHEKAGAELMLEWWPHHPLIAFLVLRHSGRWGPCDSQCIQWLIQRQIPEVDTPRNRWLADLLQVCDYTDAHFHRLIGAKT